MRKKVDGLTIEISKDVYDPAEDSFLLAENVYLSENQKILEVGSGSGYVSIYLSKKYPKNEFFCLDINPKAVQITKKNAKSNAQSIEVMNSDLFSAFKSNKEFDVILFNTPYLPVKDEGTLGKAWSGGKDGLEVISTFLNELPGYLYKNGVCFIVVSSYTNLTKLMKQIAILGLNTSKIDSINIGNEQIILYKLTFNNN